MPCSAGLPRPKQVDAGRFSSIPQSFRLIREERGVAGLYKGWAPTAVGYAAQGAIKFGCYELFKR